MVIGPQVRDCEKVIYLDVCAWCRPRDRKTTKRVKREAAEIEYLLDLAKSRGYTVLGSVLVVRELRQTRPAAKLKYLMNLYKKSVTAEAAYTKSLFKALAPKAKQAGVLGEDVYHLCFAEASGADYLITVDDVFFEAAKTLDTNVKVIYPKTFLKMEVPHGY